MQSNKAYFIEVLTSDLRKKKLKNPSYSLRAYARFLDLDPSSLSRILAGKQDPSIRISLKLVRKLALDTHRSRKLLASIAEQTKARASKRLAKEIGCANLALQAHGVDCETLEIINDANATAILEATFLDDFESRPEWIAKKLGIPVETATKTIDALLECGLLKEIEGRLVKEHGHLHAFNWQRTNSARMRQQKVFLEKAQDALEASPPSRRIISGMTMAIDPQRLPQAQEMIQVFLDELCDFLETGKRKQVYQLGVQLFPFQTDKK